MRKRDESNIQHDCVVWFRNTYGLKFMKPKRLMFAVPNEEASGSAVKGALNKAMGVLEGVSDTVIVSEGESIYCEFKTLKGKQRASQEAFQQDVENLGHEYWLVRSLEQFKQLCDAKFKKD